MRIDVHKYLIVGPAQKRELFFTQVQKLGIAEFTGAKSLSGQQPAEIQLFIDAIHILRQRVPVKQAPSIHYQSANVLARDVVDLKERIERAQERERIVRKEIERIAIFGDFSLARLKEIEQESKRVIQFFFAPSEAHPAAKGREEVLLIGSDVGMDYFMSINDKPTQYEGLIEIVIDRSLGELESDLAETVKTIEDAEIELAQLTHYKKLLEEGMLNALNQHHLEEANKTSQLFLEKEVFAVESWVPDNKIDQLEKLARELGLFLEPIQIEESDRVPTYLENKGSARLGEDLVSIYDVPSQRDRDPSNWVFFSFGLFFAMIVGDAGYGLILLAISLFLYFKFGKKASDLGRRAIFLTGSLAIGCIFWGLMTSSFLGVSVPIESPVRSFSFVNAMVKKKTEYIMTHKSSLYDEWVKEFPKLKEVKDPNAFLQGGVKEVQGKKKYVIYDAFTDNVMMELAIFIGTLHIILSFIRYLDRNWSGAGWILFLIGGYFYFPLVLKSVSLIHYVFGLPYEFGGTVGLYLIYIGLGLAWTLAIIQNKLAGSFEIMQVISVFADVMSYLRIYALSLAGMIMASTFNDIGGRLPFYVGFLIILAGHTVNFTLALMGGLIHGLRLNFIEWYHYSFEGGGKSFSPLSLLKIH